MRHMIRVAFLSLAMALSASGLSQSASADVNVYAATVSGGFGTLDLDTSTFTSLGQSFPVNSSSAIFGMGFVGSTLYGVDNNTPGAEFYSISTLNGALTHINTLSVSAVGGTTDGVNFWGVTQDAPPAVFEANISGTVINSFSLGAPVSPSNPGDGLVAFDSSGNLYISQLTGGNDELYAVNTMTNVVTDVGTLGGQAYTGLIFNNNTLYATDALNNLYTYSVSPVFGGVTQIGGPTMITNLASGDYLTALAAQPSGGAVPEPSTLVMFGIGIAVAGCSRLRRRLRSA